MPLPNYTLRAIRAAQLAGRRAARAGAKKVEPEHLLLALLGEKQVVRPILDSLKIDLAELLAPLCQIAGTNVLRPRTRPRLSGRMEKVLIHADEEARSLGSRGVDVQHLLLAVLREGGAGAGFLAGSEINYETVRRAIRGILHIAPPRNCPHCGYDLRATPERCPECGRIV